MAGKPNLPTSHQDTVGELFKASDLNDIARDVNLDYRLFDVQRFGAVPDSSNGIDGTDSTASIQAAINALGTTYKGRVYLSPNRTNTALGYKITAPLTLDGLVELSVVIYGDASASHLRGNFNGFLISRTVGTSQNGPIIIEGLDLKNYGGGGVILTGTVNACVRNCTVKAFGHCVELAANAFTCRIESVVCQSTTGSRPAGNVGIIASSHTQIVSCDVTGLNVGMVIYGDAVNVQSCRFETSIIGLAMGREPDLTTDHLVSDGLIAGCTFEANDTAIYMYHASTCALRAISMQGSVNAPSGSSKYGMRILSASSCTFSSVSPTGGFDVAAIKFDSTPDHCVFSSVTPINALGLAWVLPADTSGITFDQCNLNAVGFQTNIAATGESATAPNLASGGTIATSTGVSRVAPSAARTGVILAPGAAGGQQLTVENQGASASSITFAMDATSNVADGLAVVIPGLRKRDFTWNSFISRWMTA